ncbi:C27H6.8 [Scenedesmus sp. PABB004]|nr:C27H6.8 [Scenedesmus sp. PABB004]
MLKQTSQFKDCSIVRSRDPAVLADCDVVIDVGGVYDPAAARYDHHQRGFDEVFGHGFTTKLSSAGLVYKHYGREIVAAAMKLPEGHADVEAAYLAVYRSFMEAVDAIDNGVSQFDTDAPARYVNNSTLAARVARFNPAWNEAYTDETLDAGFAKAMALAGGEFLEAVKYVAGVWLPAKQVVAAAIQERLTVDPSGQIVVLKAGGVPWKEHLFALEEELRVSSPILYVLYEDERERKWRIQCVPPAPGSFEQRKGLPAAWRGLRDDALSEASGVPGGVFVHAGGFIGGNATYDGALEMARRAVAAE